MFEITIPFSKILIIVLDAYYLELRKSDTFFAVPVGALIRGVELVRNDLLKYWNDDNNEIVRFRHESDFNEFINRLLLNNKVLSDLVKFYNLNDVIILSSVRRKCCECDR